MIKAKTIAKNIPTGYITMNKLNNWMWWPNKPYLDKDGHWCSKADFPGDKYPHSLDPIQIRPVKDYKNL